MSKLPAGHYTNMAAAIRNLAAAREAALAAHQEIAETNRQRRLAAFRRMEEQKKIEDGIKASVASL